MNICPNAYYNYKKQRKAAYYAEKERKKALLLEIYQEYNCNPGYRMMQVYLQRQHVKICPQTVLKYMQELKIHSTVRPKKNEYKKGDGYKTFDNRLQHDFSARRPNEKWCTDFTYIRLEDGRMRYNCSIIDLYDKSAVATLNSPHMDAQLAIATLELAILVHQPQPGLILHSDQGCQYTSRAFIEYCQSNGIRQSMSRPGSPYDNAPMESFYGTFKAEFINKNHFTTDEELDEATMYFVYVYYNHIRPHSANGYLTPAKKRKL